MQSLRYMRFQCLMGLPWGQWWLTFSTANLRRYASLSIIMTWDAPLIWASFAARMPTAHTCVHGSQDHATWGKCP